MDLYGNMKLTVQLTVEGKKTYITFNAAESVSFATFGGLYSLESIYTQHCCYFPMNPSKIR